jgi:hypothetical protein
MTISEIFGILSIIMISWFLGLLIVDRLIKISFFKSFHNLKFFGKEANYERIGILIFKWIVSKTIYNYSNKNIKISKWPAQDKLIELRVEMTNSEVLHTIAFILVLLLGVPIILYHGYRSLVIPLILMNVVLNLYPALLQQYNKIKLDRIIMKRNL